jgi:Protein of unknown function (DUF2637)
MVTSYTHTHDLAVMAGWGWLATILPAAVDGLVVAGSTSLMVDRRIPNRTGHPLAWAAITIGLASSLAANVVAVDGQVPATAGALTRGNPDAARRAEQLDAIARMSC